MIRTLSLALVVLAGCPQPGSPRQRSILEGHELRNLNGTWRWTHRTQEAGTTRVETETWQFRPSREVGDPPDHYVARYVRTVEVRSDDRMPFACNQRLTYRQRAVFDLEVKLTATGYTLRETGYRTEPGPCDHGFRHAGAYTARLLGGGRLQLAFEGGDQTLFQVDDAVAELADDPWPASPSLHGPWRWDASSFDDEGNIRDESEWWHVTPRTETRVDATYRRRVTVRSRDGAPIPCAGAPTWTFDDAYILEGQREEEHWHFFERAAEPGDHPCLRVTPRRALDEATAEQLGDHVVLEWRGKRRQVLYRPE